MSCHNWKRNRNASLEWCTKNEQKLQADDSYLSSSLVLVFNAATESDLRVYKFAQGHERARTLLRWAVLECLTYTP